MKVCPIALIGILAILPSFALAQPQQKEVANVWAKAEAKMEAHLKGIDPKMRYAEFKSERLSKYLPEFRVFRGLERNTIGQLSLFIVNKDGDIADFDDDDGGAIADFLRARKIKLNSENDATEFVKFFKELQGRDEYHNDNENWNYTTEKREGGWKVKINYIGDLSLSIMVPPTYEIDIDAQGNFRDLKEKN
jgi:hypothetical protein